MKIWISLKSMADELCREYVAQSETANKKDMTALFKLDMVLYVVTSNDGKSRVYGRI